MSEDRRDEWSRPEAPGHDVERDARDEIDFHLDMRVRENLQKGMSPAEAERRFGSRQVVRRRMVCIDSGARRGRRWREAVSGAVADLTRGARSLHRRPAFAAVTVLTLALRITLLGVVLGLVASTQATRLVESWLAGVTARDPVVFLGAAAVLVATAVVACWVPAVRATRVDPVEALTEE